MSEQFAVVLALTLEKLCAALVDRIVKSVKDEAARKRLEDSIASARSARTRQEAKDAAGEVTKSF